MATSKAKTPAKKSTNAPGVWSKAQRALLSGSRRPHPLDPKIPITLQEAWAKVLTAAKAKDKEDGGPLLEDKEATQFYQPLQTAYASGQAPATLDVTAEQIRVWSLGPDPEAVQALVAFWSRIAGAHWMFIVNREPQRCAFGSVNIPDKKKAYRRRLFGGVAFDPSPSNLIFRWPVYCNSLRRYLFSLPQAEWEIARDQILQWQKTREPTQGIDPNRWSEREDEHVAFVLSRDSSIAHQLIEERDDNLHEQNLLLAALDNISLASRFVKRWASILAALGAPYIFDLVETFGKQSEPLIKEILDYAAKRKNALKAPDKKRVEAALKLALSCE